MPDRLFGDLFGLKAVVTGSSSGIGRAIALELARAGADVVVHARQSQEAAKLVAQSIRNMGRESHVLLTDLSQHDQFPEFVESCQDCLKGLDIWINNGGVDLLTGEGPTLDYQEKLARLLSIDVSATVILSKLVGERMRDAGGGCILNIGWDQSDRGMGGDSGELFSTAKNAIMGFTRSLAVSLAPKVRVNCIAPGWIRTAWGEQVGEYWQHRVLEETPLKRWGTPEDIARAARFLVSRDADYITGQVININGGAVR